MLFNAGRNRSFNAQGAATGLYHRMGLVFRMTRPALREFVMAGVRALAHQVTNATHPESRELAGFLSVPGPRGDTGMALDLEALRGEGTRGPRVRLSNAEGRHVDVDLAQVDDLIVALARARDVARGDAG